MEKGVLQVKLALLIIIVVLAAGCRNNRYEVDLSGIECDIKIRDLGSDIFDTPPYRLAAIADSLSASYGRAMRAYSTVTGLGDTSDEKWTSAFVLFATDLQNLALWDSVRKVWPDNSRLEESLENAFRHYLYYFPEADVPEIVTCITAFNNSIIIDDSLIMISLDRYLGPYSRYYPSIGIYEYQSRRMAPEYTVSDCMYAWATSVWDFSYMKYGTHTLLNTMLHEAKLLFFTRCMIPAAPDSIIFGFRQKQLEFCYDNEEQIWEYLVSNDLLFTTDGFTIRKFTGEAPFTSYFSEESPGRTVVWTGYRIIERYMRNNPEVSLSELMNLTDCQEILSGARYNPD